MVSRMLPSAVLAMFSRNRSVSLLRMYSSRVSLVFSRLTRRSESSAMPEYSWDFFSLATWDWASKMRLWVLRIWLTSAVLAARLAMRVMAGLPPES